MEVIDEAGYKAGEDIVLALDVAASEFYKDGAYHLTGEGVTWSAEELTAYYAKLTEKYPVVSIEDELHEDDWKAGQYPGQTYWGHRPTPLGMTRSSPTRHACNGVSTTESQPILVKESNWVVTSETLEAVNNAHRAGFTSVMSHRSGETEDVSIADLAVACGCGQIKTGAPCRSDRVAKYNQLLRIEEELEDAAQYAGRSILK